jgi:hypothetical protein
VAVAPEQYKHLVGDHTVHEAPFTSLLATDWNRKKIYHVDSHWADIIHEMGHVFAARTDPNNCCEYDFFGWELMLARRVGSLVAWVKRNEEYLVEDVQPLGALTPTVRRALLHERVAVVRELGLVIDDMPQSVR